jgi:hypothetical protein
MYSVRAVCSDRPAHKCAKKAWFKKWSLNLQPKFGVLNFRANRILSTAYFGTLTGLMPDIRQMADSSFHCEIDSL